MTSLIKWAFPINGFEQVNALLGASSAFDGDWAPQADVREGRDQLTIELDTPGLQSKDLDIRVEKEQLVIRGERKPAAEPESYRRIERGYGGFTRVFSLPEYVDSSAITAELAQGVLSLHLPKREESKPRQIPVAGEAVTVQAA